MVSRQHLRSTEVPDDSVEDSAVDYCARPICRREFRRTTGPGRPRAYCSELCRRSAQNELRLARQRLARFEALADQCRRDVAVFTADSDPVGRDPRHQAQTALQTATGALPFIRNLDEPAAQAFVALYEGVAPLLAQTSR